MNEKYLHIDVAFVKSELGKLFAEYPELEDDDDLRAAAVEGETGTYEIIERLLAGALEDASMAVGISNRLDDLKTRKARYELRNEAKRRLIRQIMRAAGLDKVTLTEASLSLTKARQTVGIEDLDQLPQGYYRTTRQADKVAIKSAFDRGEDIPGAFLVTGDMGLTIRTK